MRHLGWDDFLYQGFRSAMLDAGGLVLCAVGLAAWLEARFRAGGVKRAGALDRVFE